MNRTGDPAGFQLLFGLMRLLAANESIKHDALQIYLTSSYVCTRYKHCHEDLSQTLCRKPEWIHTLGPKASVLQQVRYISLVCIMEAHAW